jgi:Domain of unknown function (DUF1883)
MMADFFYDRQYLEAGDIVIVNCDHQCNVMVMTDQDFDRYKRGDRFNYHGGHYKSLPARIPVPSTGWWNAVLDLGGGSANIRYGFSYIKRNG